MRKMGNIVWQTLFQRVLHPMLGFVFLAIGVAVGCLYLAYGEVEPCRMLALENARRAQALPQYTSAELPAGMTAEQWSRLITSQMGMSDCVSGLLDSWGARLVGN